MGTLQQTSNAEKGKDPGSAGTSSGLTGVRVLRSVPEIEQIRPIWRGWQTHPNSDIDFYLTIACLRPQVHRPHVLLLYREGKPEAMLVGRLIEERMELKVGYATLLRPKVRLLNIVNRGALGNLTAENSDALVSEVAKSLSRGEADGAVFRFVRTDSALYSSLARAGRALLRESFPAVQAHRAMSLPGSVGEFYHQLSPKVRKNQRWQTKKLLQRYSDKVRIECFERLSDLERMFADVEQVASKTYQRSLSVGFVDNAETRERYRFQADRGWLRAFVLYIANRPVAFWMGDLYHRTFHSSCMGYDPEYAKYSPGMFLIMRVIEGFCERRKQQDVLAIDFGLGDAQYKEVLGDQEWQEASLYVFAPTLKGIGLNLLRTAIMALNSAARSAAERTKLLLWLKKLWRNRLRDRANCRTARS